MLTQQYLKECLFYDAETGDFVWKHRPCYHFKNSLSQKKWNTARQGKRAGGQDRCGYQRIIINAKRYQAHRLAWLYVYGEHPAHQIDHINGKRSDNRIRNLRSVTQQQNLQNVRKRDNNRSGFTGVCWSKQAGKWMAYIDYKRKRKYLGVFENIEDAVAARLNAARKYGFHDNHGR